MYYITLQLTEKGKKICGSHTKTLEMPWELQSEPTSDDVNKFIESEFMVEFVDHIIRVNSGFNNLKIGDYVCIIDPATNKKVLGSIVNVIDNGYGHYVSVKQETTEYSDYYRFNFEGFEIGGSRKNKRYLEIASTEFIDNALKIKNINNIFKDVIELLNYTYDWEDDIDYGSRDKIPIFLDPNDLIKIHDILKDSKTSYDLLNMQ